jgi:hypothetical protein
MSEFEREVIDRLARIETKIEADMAALSAHAEEDSQRFSRVVDQLDPIVLNFEVAKRVAADHGRKAGGDSGRFWGGLIAALVTAAAAAAEAMLR